MDKIDKLELKINKVIKGKKPRRFSKKAFIKIAKEVASIRSKAKEML